MAIHSYFALSVIVVAVGALQSCGQVSDLQAFDALDVQPPKVISVLPTSPTDLVVTFDEPAALSSRSLAIHPDVPVEEVGTAGLSVTLRFERPLVPGKAYAIEADAADSHQNTVHFLWPFYGLNPDLPVAVINEVIVRGSGNHPDAVEIAVLGPGNTAGLCLYQGMATNWEDRIVFPPIDVVAGEFIIVHWKPTGSPDEVNETQTKDESAGTDVHDAAWDLWVSEGTGLSGNNGVISLYETPGGPLIDALLYSNRTSSSDEDYLGFGTRDVMERALALHAEGGWPASGEEIAPEDAVSPEGSTGTRSICRDAACTDTDTADDWHIVPTRGATLGWENSESVYTPQ